MGGFGYVASALRCSEGPGGAADTVAPEERKLVDDRVSRPHSHINVLITQSSR